jgi:C4-dicarboxylate-specific signal transduction histidine kinase
LEIRVAERSQELQKKNEELLHTSKLASIGELATGVAHELNNPLNNIGLITGNLLDGLGKREVPGVTSLQENLTIVAAQVKRASEIISSLRTFGRAAGTQREAFHLHDVLTAAVLLMDRQLRLHDVDLRLKLTDEQPVVRGNAIQLEQVFVNLLTNARDAVKGSSARTVTIVSRVRHGVAEVRVQDTGTGISPEDRRRIFDPFFTTKDVGQGTGLGLSISYGIIRDHGGTILVRSKSRQGATFTVRLPLDA